MKLSNKPISSPGRAEKYPPPLMRFLRSNVGSRSRGRSRSSPMFVLRKKSTAIETQEPTSPKVTCMGQVRVRRSKQQPGKKNGAPTRRRRCKWMKNAWFCHYFNGRLKPRSFRPVWRKWVLFFRAGFFRKSKIREGSCKTESKFSSNKTEGFVQGVNGHEVEEDEEEEEEDVKVLVSSSTPPRNALLLTRCRSAPYRSSSLASRFWGSPLSDEETESRTEPENRRGGGGGEDNPTSRRESICRDSDQESIMDPETEEKMGFFKELDGSINKIRERFVKSENTQEGGGKTEEPVISVRPLILTRCKSEPARTGQKLDPEICFWNKTRFGFT